MSASAGSPAPRRFWSRLIPVVLVVLTMAAYASIINNDFINLDDGQYFFNNVHVANGLNARAIGWAWSTFHSANYHPLTWMSLQLDATLWGQNPKAVHLQNLIWHTAATVLLFHVLQRLTGATGASALVA